jgi:hypothetical protein
MSREKKWIWVMHIGDAMGLDRALDLVAVFVDWTCLSVCVSVCVHVYAAVGRYSLLCL